MNLVCIRDINLNWPARNILFEYFADSLATSTGKLSANSVFGALKGIKGCFFTKKLLDLEACCMQALKHSVNWFSDLRMGR